MPRLYVGSEVSRLKRVLLHRPNLELKRLTPTNCKDYLYDDILWVKKARQEHDNFADVLKDQNVEVLYLENLLIDILNIYEGRKWIIENRITNSLYGETLCCDLRQYLYNLPSHELTACLIGGLTKREINAYWGSLTFQCIKENDFIMPPLPNHFLCVMLLRGYMK